jgi:hypothetical protein
VSERKRSGEESDPAPLLVSLETSSAVGGAVTEAPPSKFHLLKLQRLCHNTNERLGRLSAGD